VKLEITPRPGETLADQLFDAGVEFPCGGETACGGCKIRLLSGEVPVTPMMRDALTAGELDAGWRLACCANSATPVTVEVEQWSLRILTDEAGVPIEPREGIGAVIDLGTTTLVAQLVDLSSGEVLAVETALNPQARLGADVMTRIQHDLRHRGELTKVIRESLGAMLARMAAGRELEEALLAGNTAMHHLFCGLSVEPLSRVPFESPQLGSYLTTAAELEWPCAVRGHVLFLPCLGGFVGSDLLTGIVATGLDLQAEPHALFDIGTNGEIVVGSRHRIQCASTAAGPAFEGGRISCGMRAGHGAIDSVDHELQLHVIGGGPPRGLCGSGLVDAVAAGIARDLIIPTGRIADPSRRFPLAADVTLTQADIRELQLAKGAMASGLRMLAPGGVSKLWLAGAFGNYIRLGSARAIGLLPEDLSVEPAGNTALRGARMLLLAPSQRHARVRRICVMAEHIELAADPQFQDIYAESMALSPFALR
jgi:uncharacterized 2Fe-2S/4Fe-4S cluster protein (DUF4445 family)